MVSSRINNDIAVLTVNLKYANKKESEKFKAILLENIKKGLIKFVIDFSNCEMMDSTFLSSLLIASRKISNLKGKINLVVVKSEIQSLIDITGMHEMFLIFSNVEEAVKDLK